MTLPNGTFALPPSGTTAKHTIGGIDYQVVLLAGPSGHIRDTLETYHLWSGFAAGAANKIYLDLFNATGSGKIVKLRKLFMSTNGAAITGVGLQFDVDKTTAVGTGGTVLTPRPADSLNGALPAQITARHAPTGGATKDFTWFSMGLDPEETRPAMGIMPMINWLPEHEAIQDIVLREGQGIRVIQITSNTAATMGSYLVFTTE
jgi:hypothetical protein